MSALNNSALIGASGSTGYLISRSVRLRSSASAYFNRTQATPTDEKKFTHSAWLKRGRLGVYQAAIGGRDNSTAQTPLAFNASDQIVWAESDGVSTFYSGTTTAVFRDPSAWYHIVCVYDSNNATAADRLIIYVNGVRQTITVSGSGSSIPLSRAGYWNQSGTSVLIGATNTGTDFFDGYLTEINFIDGQALTPSSFGETNPITGVWQPRKYNGTYGNNGFYLNFSDPSAATAAAIGKDYSGNGNNWTPNNISVTAGATYDSMLDVPTQWPDGGNGRGNYCVLNPLQSYGTGTLTLTNANLTSNKTVTNSDSGWTSTFALSSGKWYAEYLFTGPSVGGNNGGVGVMRVASTSVPGELSDTVRWMDFGTIRQNATSTSYGTALVANDILMVAFDADNNRIWFGKNGTWFASGNPATNTNPSATGLTNPMVPATYHFAANSVTIDANYGQRPFSYTPPSGFRALNTLNLPTPTIAKGNQYFNTVLYTGNGGTLSVTGVGFSPDFVWLKSRGAARSHRLWDVMRGPTNGWSTDLTNAEYVESGLTAFNSDGFTLGSQSGSNTNAEAFVAWNWKEGTTPGFDIVLYTGNSTASRSVNHNLGVTPSMIFVKNRTTAQNNPVAHTSLAVGNLLLFDTTGASTAAGTRLRLGNSTAFTVGDAADYTITNQTGNNYVAYCFAAIAGFSAFGSYTGNGSADGPFVFCGFRPRFVLVRLTTGLGDWIMVDTSRNTSNIVDARIDANLSSAESVLQMMDINSNGFKIRTTNTNLNTSSGTHIFAAFAENPFKYSLAR